MFKPKDCRWRRLVLLSQIVLFQLSLYHYSFAASVNFEILNKGSAKKTPLKIQENSSAVVHDMRIIPGQCHKDKDSFDGTIYRLPIRILLEQDSEEPVELYAGELTSSPRYPHRPIEHSLYDIIFVDCE